MRNDDRAGVCSRFSDDPFLCLGWGVRVHSLAASRGGVLKEAFDKVDDENKASSRRKDDAKKGAAAGSPDEALESLLQVDTLMIELGYGLVSMADPAREGTCCNGLRASGNHLRRTWVSSCHPSACVTVFSLAPTSIQFLLRGQVIASGEVMPGHWMAMNTANSTVVLKGVPTTEPVFKLPATWVDEVERRNAEMAGYTVVDASSVMVTHLSESIRRHAYQILTRQDVQVLVDTLKDDHPALVNELVPNFENIGQIQRILQNLLSEVIPIRKFGRHPRTCS